MKEYGFIIVGSGFAGSVCARKLAENKEKVLILERRNHVGGNAYDCLDENDILIHKYGPHIFHTDSDEVFEFLSRFTKWRNYEHKVVAKIGDKEIPVPFNLNSLHLVYPADKANSLEKKLIETYGAEKKVPISELRKSTDKDILELADYVYNNVFLHYTMKQWGKRPEEIDSGTTARVPVFISRDNRYFQDKHQGMPDKGYTALFENMLCHDNIDVQLNCDARERLDFRDGVIYFDGAPFGGKIIYSGALDELFGYTLGALPYRTLDFDFETHKCDFYQSHGTVNYTVDMPYTRITEFKYLTGQKKDGVTSVVKEYSKKYTPNSPEIPYYAVINEENNALYNRYLKKACSYPSLILLGRLAEYKYYNMDKIVLLALELCRKILSEALCEAR